MFIKYTVSEAMLCEEMENFITSITGYVCDGESEKEEDAIGKIEASYVDIVNAIEAGCPLSELFDFPSQTYANHHEALFSKEGSLYKFLSKKELVFDWPSDTENLLFIDSMTLLPAYRGRNVGLAMLNRTIQRFAQGCQFVILEVGPLQCMEHHIKEHPELKLEGFDPSTTKATKSLAAYYEKLGFKLVPDSQYMVLDLQLKRPELPEINFEEEDRPEVFFPASDLGRCH